MGVGDVGGAGDGEVGPFAGGDGGDAFAQVHDGGAFIFEDFFVGVDADDEVFAELFCLEHCAGVAWVGGGGVWLVCDLGGDWVRRRSTVVGEVEAAVDPDPVFVHGDGRRGGVFGQGVGRDRCGRHCGGRSQLCCCGRLLGIRSCAGVN